MNNKQIVHNLHLNQGIWRINQNRSLILEGLVVIHLICLDLAGLRVIMEHYDSVV